jgi:hypothetical protein
VRRLSALAALSLLALAPLAGCEDTSYRKIGAEISLLARRGQDPGTDGARQRLVAFGRPAIPQIETALHTAKEPGRLQLVAALADIGDAEAIPILRHFAVYDTSAAVREACSAILRGWSTSSDARAGAARLALTRVAELRDRGEMPTPARR